MSADLVDFFERINVQKLQVCIEHFVREAYGRRDADFVNKLVDGILHNKYFYVSGRILWKRASLSIGEQIATSAANLLRHHSFDHAVAEFSGSGYLQLWAGYVDDCFFVWSGGIDNLHRFVSVLDNVDPEQFEWTYSDFQQSTRETNFLDLNLPLRDDGSIKTSTYRKPRFHPQYLHACSVHPAHC